MRFSQCAAGKFHPLKGQTDCEMCGEGRFFNSEGDPLFSNTLQTHDLSIVSSN